MRTDKIKLKGNESFNIREGWLRKGLKYLNENSELYAPDIFTRDDATDKLGIGTKMVKSLRFWMQATGLTIEEVMVGSKRRQVITPDFGRVIIQYDTYFEDIFTQWLIHCNIASNEKLCMAWYLFFNEFKATEFTRESLLQALKKLLEKKVREEDYSENSFADDCNSVIKTYFNDDKGYKDPEDNLSCPLSELGLIKKSDSNKNVFIKAKPVYDNLDKLAVLYIIRRNLVEGKNSISIEAILNDNCNAGKLFNLDRTMLNEYLDALRIEGYLTINRTAGLDMVYVNEIEPRKILEIYYEQ